MKIDTIICTVAEGCRVVYPVAEAGTYDALPFWQLSYPNAKIITCDIDEVWGEIGIAETTLTIEGVSVTYCGLILPRLVS